MGLLEKDVQRKGHRGPYWKGGSCPEQGQIRENLHYMGKVTLKTLPLARGGNGVPMALRKQAVARGCVSQAILGGITVLYWAK